MVIYSLTIKANLSKGKDAKLKGPLKIFSRAAWLPKKTMTKSIKA